MDDLHYHDEDGSSSSDDEAFFPILVTGIARYCRRKREASVKKTRKTINRDRAAAHELLVRDYFAEDCLYDDKQFKRRFRLNKSCPSLV